MLAEKEAVDDTASAVEEPFVPEILENSLLAETPVYDPIVENGDDPVDSIQESVPDDIATQQPSQPEKRRRGLFRLRQAEPSNMQGTSFPLFAMNL